MINLIKKLFRKDDPDAGCFTSEGMDWKERGLTRKRKPNIKIGSYRTGNSFNLTEYEYICKCGTKLTDGPCGGASVNAVCRECRINYGCLPGYWGE